MVTTTESVGGTPLYVLMDGNSRVGPKMQPQSELTGSPIYGFSDKSHYDTFCRAGPSALTPYPLVKAFLRNQPGGAEHKLVVVDAIGPSEPLLHAATMDAVLEAQENRTARVTVTHHLIFDRAADAYRVEKVSA